MKLVLVLALVVATLTACGGGSSTPETTTVAGGTTSPTTPTPTPAPTPSPTPSPTPTPAPSPSPATSQGEIGHNKWGYLQCAGCHGGNTSKGVNAALTMSSMQTVQKHKEAYGPTAISPWNITITQQDADDIAVYAANPSLYDKVCTQAAPCK
jgi:mono/diheme cytochrome c family protein